MKLDIFCSAVHKALEQASLLAEVDLIKDYSNHSLILKLTKIKEENDSLLSFSHSNNVYDTEFGGYHHDASNGEIAKNLKIQKYHTGEKPFKCDRCNYECAEASNLKQHKQKHSEKNIYFCKYCDYGTKYKHSIQNHEKVMHAYSGSLFQCSLCDFKTLHDHRRVAHIKAHEENVHFDCNVCGKILFDERDFKYHLRKHKAEPRKKNIVCAKCDKKFCSSEQLKAHMFLHTGKKEYKCRLCGLEYRGFKNMKKHFVKQHPNEKIFYCEPCSFSTDNLRENNRHASTAKHVEKIS